MAGRAVSHRRTWLNSTSKPSSATSFFAAKSDCSTFSTQEDTFDDGASMRNNRLQYSCGLYLGMSSVFALSECISVSESTVIFATGCLRRYVRVYRLPYHTFSSLDHWGVDHHELVYLYYRNLSSITSSLSSAHIPIADREVGRHQDRSDTTERSADGTSASDRDDDPGA